MTPTVVAISVLAASLIFCLTQFLHLMRRRDDEFPGKFDKPIWAAAILFGNVVGAFAYWLAKPRQAPESSDALKREFASVQKNRAANFNQSASPG